MITPLLTLSRHQLEERSMPRVPTTKLTRRRGGHPSSSKGGGSHGIPGSPGRKSGKSSGSKLKTSNVDGLPKGHNKATTYGKGGGSPFNVKKGPLKGWRVGGGTRREVYGSRLVFTISYIPKPFLNPLCSYHPSIPAPNTLPWGFIPIAISLEIFALEEGVSPYPVSVGPLLVSPAALDADSTSPTVLP